MKNKKEELIAKVIGSQNYYLPSSTVCIELGRGLHRLSEMHLEHLVVLVDLIKARIPQVEYRVRFEDDDALSIGECFDAENFDVDDMIRKVDDGEARWLRAIVERKCTKCGAWWYADSLSGIYADCNEEGDAYLKMTEQDLLDEARRAG